MSEQSLITVESGVPLADSRTIAEHCMVNPKHLRELIVDRLEVIEENFGRVRFETAPLETAGGIQKTARVLLTEDQATFVVTLTRNTEPVIKFKAALVKAFAEAKRKLANQQLSASQPVLEIGALIEQMTSKGVSADAAARVAGEIVKASLPLMVKAGRHVLGVSRDSIDDEYVLAAIRKAGRLGSSKHALTRRTQKFNAYHRDTIIKRLIDSGRIEQIASRPLRYQVIR